MRGALWYLVVTLGILGGYAGSSSPRLPRTSAGQLAAAAAAQNKTSAQLRKGNVITSTVGPPPARGASIRTRYVLKSKIT